MMSEKEVFQHVHVFLQGEDVSMGIWMAAVGPRKYQVKTDTPSETNYCFDQYNQSHRFDISLFVCS